MTPSTEHRRELAHRSGDGIAVHLFWSKPTDTVTIALIDDRLDEWLEFAVNRRKALDAFHHPYTYAPQQTTTRFISVREAVQR
jgi:hypothetical protein